MSSTLDNNNETETNHNIDRGIEEVKIAESECDLPLIRLMSDDINNDINANISERDDNNLKTNSSSNMISRYYRDFEEIECIGYGAFGTVYKVKHKLDSSIYAIKKIIYKHDSINHEHIKNQIIREIKNIAQLNHQNIVRYYTAWIENGPITGNNNMKNKNDINIEKQCKINSKNDSNVMSFFDYELDHETDMTAARDGVQLNPSGSIPIVRTNSNEGLSLLLSSYSNKSLNSPIPSIPKSIANISTDKNIVSYWKNHTVYSCLFLQTEYCGKYTLKDYINDPNRIPERDNTMHILSQILLGLAHIHSKLLLHRY